MPIAHINDDGTEVELFTAEERDAQVAAEKARAEAAEDRVGVLTNDLVRMKQGHSSEIKRLSELSEEEKGKLSTEQQQTMQRLEAVEDARKKDLDAAKERLFASVAGNNPDILAKLREKYALVQMPETTVEEVSARLNSVSSWAFAELGVTSHRPVSAGLPGMGGSPTIKTEEGKSFADTEKGTEIAKQMFGNVIPEKK